MPGSILLVRHGQSTWNAEGRWQGQADPPLTDLGRSQAGEAAAALAAHTFGAVATSDLARAAETARIICADNGWPAPTVDGRLRERHAGVYQGLTKPEIETRWPGALASESIPEGWEHDEAVADRAHQALMALAQRAGGEPALAVTHGGVIYALETTVGGSWERIGNLGGQWIELSPDGEVSMGPRIHLAEHETVPDQL